MTQQTPIMEQAAKAAETVAKWSDAKKEYARRVIASGSYMTLSTVTTADQK